MLSLFSVGAMLATACQTIQEPLQPIAEEPVKDDCDEELEVAVLESQTDGPTRNRTTVEETRTTRPTTPPTVKPPTEPVGPVKCPPPPPPPPPAMCPWTQGTRLMSEAHPSAAQTVVITEHAGDDHITVGPGVATKTITADYLNGTDWYAYKIFNRDVDTNANIYCYADDPMGEQGAYAVGTAALEPGGNPVYARIIKPGVLDGDLVVVERLGTGASPINDALAMRLDERVFDPALMNSLLGQAEVATENAIAGLFDGSSNLTVNSVNVDYNANIDFRATPGPNGGVDLTASATNVSLSLNYNPLLANCDFNVFLIGTTTIGVNANFNNSTTNPVDITGFDLALPLPIFTGTGLVCGVGAGLMNLVSAAFAPPLIQLAAADIENFFSPLVDNWLDSRISEALTGITSSASTSPFIASVTVDTMRADNNGLMVSLDVGSTTNTWHAVGSPDVTPLLSQRNTTDGSVFDLSLFISPDLFNAGMRHAVDAGVSLGIVQPLDASQGQEIVNNVVGAGNGYSATGWSLAVRQDTAPRMADFGQAEPGLVLDAVVIDLLYGGQRVAQYVTMIENVGVHGDIGSAWNFSVILDLMNSNCNDDFGATMMCLPTVVIDLNDDAAAYNEVNPTAIFVPGSVAGSLINTAVDMVGIESVLPSATLFGVVSLMPVPGELAGIDRFHLQFDALPPVEVNVSNLPGYPIMDELDISAYYTVRFNVTTSGMTGVSVTFDNITNVDTWNTSGSTAAESQLLVYCDDLPQNTYQVATGSVTGTVATANGPFTVTIPFSEVHSTTIELDDVYWCNEEY